MKSTLTAVVAWTFAGVITLLAVAVGFALMAPLFDTAWMRLQGSPATLLRWLVCGGLALGGLAIIQAAWGQVMAACDALRSHAKAAGGPIAH